ncbi:MAG: sensor histidine kinase, partial [Acidimicrobiia bacterium]
AALIAGAYVVWVEATPMRLRVHQWWGQVITVAGVGASMVAVALTGGVDSGYLLLSISPVILAAAFLGARVGIEAALLAAGTLIAVAQFAGQDPVTGTTLVFGALYVMLGTAFAQARRILTEARQRTAEAQAAARSHQRLVTAHRLLDRLAELIESAHLSPHEVARETVRAVRAVLPTAGVAVKLAGPGGPTTVAVEGRRYQPHKEEFPLLMEDRHLGSVGVATAAPLDAETRQVVAAAVSQAAVAVDSIRLLRTIATRAIREERVRLARDLHDDIGPRLASLGLGLDVIIQQSDDRLLVTDLVRLRSGIEATVEQIRTAVADLRAEDGVGLAGRIRTLAEDIPLGGPELVIDLDEAALPGPAVFGDVTAIVSEAVRNAVQHANAGTIRVEGRVGGDGGEVYVRDDGTGFHVADDHAGHFGLVGMKERADRAGANLQVASSPQSGTRVTLRWGAS